MSHIKRDYQAMLDQLATAMEMKYQEGIIWAKRELHALEDEMNYHRYGRTDVQ